MGSHQQAMGAILPLPLDVRAQIQSSIAITSLNDVAVELLKNSLDAEATNVRICINPGKGACEVEDNGIGIPAPVFESHGGLGQHFRKGGISKVLGGKC